MYIEDRLFSENNPEEVLYSVTMTEEEHDLFSEFLEERIYFQSAGTGEYYTGKELLEEAQKVRAERINGTLKYTSGKPVGRRLSREKSIREAYINKNAGFDKDRYKSIEELEKTRDKGFKYLTKKGLVKNVKPTGAYTIPSSTEIKVKRALGKLAKKFK